MTTAEVRQRLVEGGLLPANVVDRRLAEWRAADRVDDGYEFLRDLERSGELSPPQHASLATGLPAGFAIGPYRLEAEIGLGRIGRTFRAVHAEFGQSVSLKLFPSTLASDAERATQLARETRVAVQADDPHVLRTYQVGRVDRWVFLVNEPLVGETLGDRLAREGRLPMLESLRVARHVALGLAHLHEREIVHRDVQPRNIWLHVDGRALLTEFAASRDALAFLDVDEGVAQGGFHFTDDALVNFDYLAAEQGVDLSLADGRSDLYALGCVLYRCLTGEVVFPDANPVRKMLRHALIEAPRPSAIVDHLPPGTDDVVALLLAKHPDDRYQRATDVAWALESLIAADVEHAVAVDEVSPDFLAWANATPELVADPAAGVLGEREFVDFLGHLVDEERAEAEDGEAEDEDELDASEGVLV